MAHIFLIVKIGCIEAVLTDAVLELYSTGTVLKINLARDHKKGNGRVDYKRKENMSQQPPRG